MTELQQVIDKAKDKWENDEEQMADISQAEIEANEYQFWQEYASLDGSKKIVDVLLKKIKDYVQALITEDEPVKRAGLKGRKGECEELLKRFTNNYDQLLKQLEEDLKQLL